jgi:cell wall-associated NlpC family hydrolase
VKQQKTEDVKSTEALKESEQEKPAKDGKTASKGKTTENAKLSENGKTTETMNMVNNDSNTRGKNNLPQAGIKSIANLLMTGKQPIGKTMYIWGGGWNEADTGAGVEAVHIGVSSTWAEFAASQNASYDYKNTRYQIHNGLDCSGFIGWTVYNVLNNTNGGTGYVMKATTMAQTFSENGWGTYTPAGKVKDWKPGDVMSMKGHVWFSLGMCEDGSVVVMHASPPGTRICGTNLSDGSKSQAVKLAESYMSKYYPNWYAKYPDCSETINYLSDSGQMRWNTKTLSDAEGIQKMNAKQVLEFLYQ